MDRPKLDRFEAKVGQVAEDLESRSFILGEDQSIRIVHPVPFGSEMELLAPWLAVQAHCNRAGCLSPSVAERRIDDTPEGFPRSVAAQVFTEDVERAAEYGGA
jgi:hypothetical protein